MINTSYTETANMNLRIPTRSEFHKYAMETLNVGDFLQTGAKKVVKKVTRLPDQLHGLKILGRTLENNTVNASL